MENVKYDQIVEFYMAKRAELDALETAHKAAKAQITAAMEKCEAVIQKMFNESGLTSVRTPFGTAYQSTLSKVKVADWESALNWIRENNRWDALERRINKTVAQENDIPGVAIEHLKQVVFRTL